MENLLLLGVPILKHIKVNGCKPVLSKHEWLLKAGFAKTGQKYGVLACLNMFFA